MATYNFTGSLNSNEIFAAIYNMIISQTVFSPEVANNYDLVDKFRVDGSLYGDTKLFYSTDVLATQPWGNDAEATNLLKLHRPEAPECQAVTIDQFRMIPLTIDNYLTKRAWSDESTFSQFNSVMMSWIRTTKRIYDTTLINTFVGTTDSKANKAIVEIDVTNKVGSATGEEKNRLRAQAIAEGLANLMVDMKDISRDYTDYKNLRAYNESDLMMIVNSKYANEITKLDLPTIFHNDGLKLTENILPARYFGHVQSTAVTKANNDGTYRSLIEADYATATGVKPTHVFPGDIIPSATAKVTDFNENGTAKAISAGIGANDAYKEASDIICKIVHKDAVPFMSAFETSTSFFNPRSLTETHYLIWGYSTPVYLYDKPFITVEED